MTITGLASSTSYTTRIALLVAVTPKTAGRPVERLTVALWAGSSRACSTSSIESPFAAMCWTLPLGSSSSSHAIRSNSIIAGLADTVC
jgi:hypothetical protein